MINCIIWDCPTTLELSDSPWEGDLGSHVTVDHCIIENGQDDLSVSENSTVTWLEGNISDDPLFVDPDNDDFHLSIDSPCIDAGTTDLPKSLELPATDFEGDPRVIGDAPDIGADEAHTEQ